MSSQRRASSVPSCAKRQHPCPEPPDMSAVRSGQRTGAQSARSSTGRGCRRAVLHRARRTSQSSRRGPAAVIKDIEGRGNVPRSASIDVVAEFSRSGENADTDANPPEGLAQGWHYLSVSACLGFRRPGSIGTDRASCCWELASPLPGLHTTNLTFLSSLDFLGIQSSSLVFLRVRRRVRGRRRRPSIRGMLPFSARPGHRDPRST